MEAEPGRFDKLRQNTAAIHKALADVVSSIDQDASDSLTLVGDELSPLKHLYLRTGTDDRAKDDATLQRICDVLSEEHMIAVAVSDASPLQKRAPKPSIRVTVSSGHTHAQITHLANSLRKAAASVFHGRVR